MSDKIADKIQKLLALAEAEAKAGNEGARDTLLEKAAALQLKYAIADAMLARTGAKAEEIGYADFCRESNTPLVKAKRQLINDLAYLNRGKALLMSEWQDCPRSKRYPTGRKLNRRAYIRVYAHESDLAFIGQLYTSLILQMQTMMAADERDMRNIGDPPLAGWQGWRVSYSYGWVGRVVARMYEAKRRNEAAEETGTPGTALVLADRKALVDAHIGDMFGKLRNSKVRRDDHDPSGRAAGRAAGDRADLGGKKVQGEAARRIEA
jgi:hypothetical protein